MKICTLLSLMLLTVAPLRGADLTESKFSQVIKDVKVVARQTETAAPAKVDDVFKSPDLIRTGADSLAELVASDKTITRVGANTVFSFEKAGRAINLEQGSVLFHSPKGKGGGTIRTKGASAAVLGTTIVVTATAGGGFKAIVLEGKGQITLPNGNFRILTAGQVTFVLPGSQRFGPQLNINLSKLVENSRLVQGFEQDLPSKPIILAAIERQLTLMAKGILEPTPLLVGNDATEETLVTVLEQAVENRVDRLAVAKATDVVIRTPNLTDHPAHVFADPVSFDIPALGTLNRSGFIGRNITVAPTVSQLDFTPFLSQTDFTLGAQEYLHIQTTALQLSANLQSMRSPALQRVTFAGKLGLSIASGASISAFHIGELHFVTGGMMSLNNVSFANFGGKVRLNAEQGLDLTGGGINATPAMTLEGAVVRITGGTYNVTGTALVSAYGNELQTDGATFSGDIISLQANTSSDLHATTATATTLLNLNSELDVRISGGAYTASGPGGTLQVHADRDIFVDTGARFAAHAIQLNTVGSATIMGLSAIAGGTNQFSAGQDLTLVGGSLSATDPSGRVQLTAGQTLSASGTSLFADTIQASGHTVNLTAVNASGFTTFSATAGHNLTLAQGTYTGAGTPSSSATLTAGDTLAANATTFASLATLNLAGRVVNLTDGTFPSAATVTVNGTDQVNLNSPLDLTVNPALYAVSANNGTLQATASRDLATTSGAQFQANTIQLNAARDASLNNPVARGFTTLNATAVRNLSVASGSITGVSSAPSIAANLSAGDTLTVNGTSFANVADISLSARTVNLANLNFPAGSIVNLYSQTGLLAANPNTGAASVPGHVNFILNVNYGGNPAQLFVGGNINLGVRP
ncbi:MAG: hypothetical protein RL514_2265 [Verrucomicrobiota bacterium]|jgi:hypothetical protein